MQKILPEKRISTKYDTNQWVPFELIFTNKHCIFGRKNNNFWTVTK